MAEDCLENHNICPICGKENYSTDDFWYEFDSNYHCSCIRELEKQGKPFHEKYSKQKRIPAKQVLEVLDLLHDKYFLDYWLFVICSKKEQEKLYSHPILLSNENEEGLDLFP